MELEWDSHEDVQDIEWPLCNVFVLTFKLEWDQLNYTDVVAGGACAINV